jgi:hypothetical protein
MTDNNSESDFNINIVDPNIRNVSLTGVIPDNRTNIGGLNNLQDVRNDVDAILRIVKPASQGIHTRYIASFDRPEGEIGELNNTGDRTIQVFDQIIIDPTTTLKLQQSTILPDAQTALYVNNTGVVTVSDPRVKKNIRPINREEILNTVRRFESVPLHTYNYNSNSSKIMGFNENDRVNGYLSTDFEKMYPLSVTIHDMSSEGLPNDTRQIDVYKELLSRDVPVILKYLLNEIEELKRENSNIKMELEKINKGV